MNGGFLLAGKFIEEFSLWCGDYVIEVLYKYRHNFQVSHVQR